MMFKIRIRVSCRSIQGLRALDWRRIRGLSDAAQVAIQGTQYSREVDVPETFARRHAAIFEDSTTDVRDVEPDTLVKGDLIEPPNSTSYLMLNPDMTDERIRELWEIGLSD